MDSMSGCFCWNCTSLFLLQLLVAWFSTLESHVNGVRFCLFGLLVGWRALLVFFWLVCGVFVYGCLFYLRVFIGMYVYSGGCPPSWFVAAEVCLEFGFRCLLF